ncbi:MAG: type III pantothenate kinase [Chloroflexi bacterium]|nr:type III pantothenate kinase [Chloroflexota bacterium]
MLLAIDIGNTNTVFGLYDRDDALRHVWRLSTDLRRSADEYFATLVSLASINDFHLLETIDHVIIGSVSPPVTETLVRMCRRRMNVEPILAGIHLDLGMEVQVREPHRVGVDRLLNALAARERFGAPCIALDFGTATKFDVVDEAGDFVGGVIAPGLRHAADALFRDAAQLHRVEFAAPPSPIGNDTTSAMQSGIVLGYLSLVEGMIQRIQAVLPGQRAPVVATGGLAGLIVPLTDAIDHHIPTLTLDGLAMVFRRTQKQ